MRAESRVGKIDAQVQAREQGGAVATDGSMRYAAATKPTDSLTFSAETYNVNETAVNSLRKDKSQLQILSFPGNLGRQSGTGIPYVLFKIFETSVGQVPVGDETTASLRAGSNAAYQMLDAFPAGTTVAATAAGGAAGGGLGAAAGFLASTQGGKEFIDNTANNLFGAISGGITNRAKELIKDFALKRNVEQLSEAIALFMPDGITTNYDNDYEAISVTATLGNLGLAAQALGTKTGETAQINPFIAEAAGSLASAVLGNDDFKRLGLFATTGRVVNPQLEMIYSSPVLRKFVFDFRLIPRNARESQEIARIIRALKFYAAPEIPQGAGGRYLIPPAQFEIEFYKGNEALNQYLFKTKKCVLSGISIDYAPNGYATFDDGAPVETRMQLTFQETVIIDRKAVNEGY